MIIITLFCRATLLREVTAMYQSSDKLTITDHCFVNFHLL